MPHLGRLVTCSVPALLAAHGSFVRTFHSCVCNTFSSPKILEAMLRLTVVRDSDHTELGIHMKRATGLLLQMRNCRSNTRNDFSALHSSTLVLQDSFAAPRVPKLLIANRHSLYPRQNRTAARISPVALFITAVLTISWHHSSS
jgi:hypothetical protein